MKPDLYTPLTDDELHALVDSQGSATALAGLRMRLVNDPDAQRRLTQWQRQREQLQRLHVGVLREAVPTELQQVVRREKTIRQQRTNWLRLGGMAASVTLAFGVGWLANTSWHAMSSPSAETQRLTRAQTAQNFVRQASLAHGIYTPEVKHPVEVSAQEQAHLVQWLSKRLGKSLKVPDLSAQGFDLVGGRLLPGDTGARAQFMFQNNAALRVTLYLGALGKENIQGLSSQETSFRFDQQLEVASFYWVDQGFGYALTAQMPRESLMKLAELVYQQL